VSRSHDGLKFGARMEGTKRNHDAIDWLEKQLRSFGYSNVVRQQFMSTSGPIENVYATKVGTETPAGVTLVTPQ